jgi:hypothetical protein
MLNLQAMKHGLKRALGEYEAEDGDEDGMEYGKEDVENTDANNESAMMQEPLWMPAVAPVRAKGGRATCSSTDAYERQKKARESVTPVRSLDLVYDGFESPTVTANEGSLFSSRKYRQQTAVDQSLYYASVERDAATSTERIVALWGPNNTSGAEHAGDEKGNPFAGFLHK